MLCLVPLANLRLIMARRELHSGASTAVRASERGIVDCNKRTFVSHTTITNQVVVSDIPLSITNSARGAQEKCDPVHKMQHTSRDVARWFCMLSRQLHLAHNGQVNELSLRRNKGALVSHTTATNQDVDELPYWQTAVSFTSTAPT